MARLVILVVSAIFVLPAFAAADQIPDIKPGLWQIESDIGGRASGPVKQCIDQATIKQMLNAGQTMTGGICSGFKIEKEGDKYITTTSCAMGPMKMVARSEMQGDFQKSYTTVTHTQMTPAMSGNSNMKTVSKATYLGACEAGMKPGDVITASGRKMNVIENMQKMKEKMPEINKMMQEVMKHRASAK